VTFYRLGRKITFDMIKSYPLFVGALALAVSAVAARTHSAPFARGKISHRKLGQTYTYYDLGPNFTPESINPEGTPAPIGFIVGTSPVSGTVTVDAYFTFRTPGAGNGVATISGINSVPLLSGGTYFDTGVPVFVDDAGNIVGTDIGVGTSLPGPHGYVWNAVSQGAAALMAGNGGNGNVFPFGMPNEGISLIVGQDVWNQWGAIWAGGPFVTPSIVANPYVIDDGIALIFYAVNDSGNCITGDTNTSTSNNSIYSGGSFAILTNAVTAKAINDSNEVAGSSPHPTNTPPLHTYNPTACVWMSPTSSPTFLDDATTMTAAATAMTNVPNPVVSSMPLTVVGNFTVEYPTAMPIEAFVWTATAGLVNLNTLTSLPTNVTLTNAVAIDNYGDIIGTSTVPSTGGPHPGGGVGVGGTTVHAFLLVPNNGP
jgi:hypothetical protein